MTDEPIFYISRRRRVAAWSVHLFTASGGVFGLLSLYAIYHQQYIVAFWLMGAAVIVDSVDGVLARRAQTKIAAPRVDGGLLDNILDYVNYVTVPAFFLLVANLLPPGWAFVGASVIMLASAYQFTQPEAKTEDHFFKGFPSYWNFIVFYLFLWQTPPWVNLVIVLILVVLVFVPIKYVYPSRLDYLTHSRWLRRGMLFATLLWGAATAALLWIYPRTNFVLVTLSILYIALYIVLSVYRTFRPIEPLPRGPRRNVIAAPLERLRKLRQRRWPLRRRR
ncbi:MAG: phosphatidylcholine synthase [Chloroflexota bacterium]|nr:MAG: phosphatidylcholine synthase [Chloroflexota bacterium]